MTYSDLEAALDELRKHPAKPGSSKGDLKLHNALRLELRAFFALYLPRRMGADYPEPHCHISPLGIAEGEDTLDALQLEEGFKCVNAYSKNTSSAE